MEELKPGDIVKLKSGGPLMTISEAVYDLGVLTDKWLCKWFENNKLLSGEFPKNSLTKDNGAPLMPIVL